MSTVQQKIGRPNSSSHQCILPYRVGISPSFFYDRASRFLSAALVLIWGHAHLG